MIRGAPVTLLLLALCSAPLALAHPLGNSTVNRWAQITVMPQQVELEYVLDLAELPTLVESSAADADHDASVTQAEWDRHAIAWAHALLPALRVEIAGRPLRWQVRTQRARAEPGEAGLNILRLEASLRAVLVDPLPSGVGTLHYRDSTNASTLGWKEVVLRTTGDVVLQASTLAELDRSRRLTDYPAAAELPDVTAGTATLRFPRAASKTGSAPARAERRPAEARAMSPNPPPALVPEAAPPPPATSFLSSYFRLGIHHIVTGWDHLLFLLGLLLLRLPARQTIGVVTAFTLAHSLTLGLAAAGYVTPPASWIEPAIALSIAYVGVVSLLRRGSRHGIPLAFGFGLIHGFGFAGALAESSAGELAHGTRFLLSLASFNLGIEAVQLLIVVVLAPALAWLARRAWFAPVERAAGGGLVLVGTLVFALRVIAEG